MARPDVRRLHAETDEFQLALSLLSNRRQRTRQGRFVVEGVVGIDRLIERGWTVESFWHARGAHLSSWARKLLDSSVARFHYEVPAELMAQLSGKDETSELLAVAEMPADDLERIPLREQALVVVFDRPGSPGNLGSVIRSSEALGADGVVVTGHAADVYDPQTVRASVGTLFAIPVVRAGGGEDVDDWIAALRRSLPGLRVVGSSARAELEAGSIDFTGPTLLVVGNETKGLSCAWRERCDELALIPMRGSASSLNAAAAASVLLYEIDRQRRRNRA